MTNNLKLISECILAVLIVLVVLKLLNVVSVRIPKNKPTSAAPAVRFSINDLHSKYVRISAITGIKNKRVHPCSDYMDFVMPEANKPDMPELPENGLATLECGESSYE